MRAMLKKNFFFLNKASFLRFAPKLEI